MNDAAVTSGISSTTPGTAPSSASASVDHSSTSASVAARTTTPKARYGTTQTKPGRPLGSHKPPSQSFKNDVAILRAEGLTQGATAKLLDVSTRTVIRTEHLPDVQERIKSLREKWQQIAHDKLTGMADQTWEMAAGAVANGDTKGFDNTMRGLVAMEKISASVAGERQKVDVTGIPSSPHVDIRAIFAQLFATT